MAKEVRAAVGREKYSWVISARGRGLGNDVHAHVVLTWCGEYQWVRGDFAIYVEVLFAHVNKAAVHIHVAQDFVLRRMRGWDHHLGSHRIASANDFLLASSNRLIHVRELTEVTRDFKFWKRDSSRRCGDVLTG